MGTATAARARHSPRSTAAVTRQNLPAGQLSQQPQGIIPGAMVGHGGFIYECLAVAGGMALCRWPGSVGPSVVYPYGPRDYFLPAIASFPLTTLRSFPMPQILPAPAQPDSGIGPGAIVRNGRSLGPWVVLEANGNRAKCRQISGYAQAMVFEVEMGQLSPWESAIASSAKEPNND